MAVLAFPAAADEQPTREPPDAGLRIRATVDLRDGSRLVGEPAISSLPLALEFATLDVPMARIRRCDVWDKGASLQIELVNGDRLTATLSHDRFPLKTLVGELAPTFDTIDRLTFATWRESDLPPGEGGIEFGGVRWTAWRTPFEIQGDRLVSLPRARDGYSYGHFANGRSPEIVTNIGNPEWRDYRVEAEFGVKGPDPAFNPHGLEAEFHGGGIWFHIVDAKESWNESGSSSYRLNLEGNGGWSLDCVYNDYCRQPVGFGNNASDGHRVLASGNGVALDRANGNRFRIDVKGHRIRVWVDDRKIADVSDEKMGEAIGDKTLDHGGVAFIGGFESMIWVRNVSFTAL